MNEEHLSRVDDWQAKAQAYINALHQILWQHVGSGASLKTAGQDEGIISYSGAGVPPSFDGIKASWLLARNDHAALKAYKDFFYRAAIQSSPMPPPSLLAAMASRESRAGKLLVSDRSSSRYGFPKFEPRNLGYGLMQIDVGKNPQLNARKYNPFSQEHIIQATGLLCSFWRTVNTQSTTKGWPEAQRLRGALVAYNSGPGNVRTIPGMDIGTPGNDYSNDIWARACWLAVYLYGVDAPQGAVGCPPQSYSRSVS